ncbi:hypothetical protein GON03_03910 [Nocardioides sp. MAH-18]|uniref:HK97 family phage prohead protease n=1 Tax=Nocardioides agri TaxID=2682843 RepID=A0A6L6XM89_9ACTN|nr:MULTISPECIES: hypothetical protein [unclassified Nocardioides]MBA2953446.1 hypothetical protein [Nocardioides sp. CGMCC 1.13656]MVQ48314.1 hypothetical protein [Nocardioides sp. MAH-18]
MLLGTIPFGGHVELRGGRLLELVPETLEDFLDPGTRGTTPILFDHDPADPVGWLTAVKTKHHRLLIYGDLNDTYPRARAAERLIRSGTMRGLSPRVIVRDDDRMYAPTGAWGRGLVASVPEVSVVWRPRITGAAWQVG